MKTTHIQQRPHSPHAGFASSRFNFSVITLAVSCAFFAFGCEGRRPTAKEPETIPPPVTTAPVLAPPTIPSNTPAASESEKALEQPTPTGRVADDASRAVGTIDATSDRDPEADSTPPAGANAGAPPNVSPTATALKPPSASATDEEDVSSALRREVAEMERRRARQPRGW